LTSEAEIEGEIAGLSDIEQEAEYIQSDFSNTRNKPSSVPVNAVQRAQRRRIGSVRTTRARI